MNKVGWFVRIQPKPILSLQSYFLNIQVCPLTTQLMATPMQIRVDKFNTGLLGLAQTEEASQTVSDLLQKDMERHHIFFNASGFHNHVKFSSLICFEIACPLLFLSQCYDLVISYCTKYHNRHASHAPLHDSNITGIW